MAIVVFAAFLATAAAQFEVTGTIEGTIDGEARTWYALEYQSDEGTDGTAWLRDLGNEVFTMMLVEVQAHDEPRYKIEGTLTLGGSLSRALDTCPCTLSEVEVLYFPTSSMFTDVYHSLQAELVVERAEPAHDGTVHITGTFTAELGLVEDVMQGTEPDPERAITVEGRFDLGRVLANE